MIEVGAGREQARSRSTARYTVERATPKEFGELGARMPASTVEIDEVRFLLWAELRLLRGTAADNRWDTIARPHRAADLDTRGSAGRSRAIRAAVLAVLDRGVTNPGAIGAAARAAMRAGDPYRYQLELWPAPDER